jgi:hypothetical protein
LFYLDDKKPVEVQKESQHCESQLHKQTILGIGPKERLQTHNNTGKALGYSSLYGYAVTSLMPGYPCNEKTECSNYDRAFFEEEVYMTGPASLNNRSASLRALTYRFEIFDIDFQFTYLPFGHVFRIFPEFHRSRFQRR